MNAILRTGQALATTGDGVSDSVLATKLAAKYPGRVTGTLLLPGQAGDYAPLPDDVPEALARALRSRGIDRLYRHQADSTGSV